MKKPRVFRARSTAFARRPASWHQSASSLMVLAGLGVLSFALPGDAHAQRAIAPNTLPVLRSVVSDRQGVSFSTSAPGAPRSLLTIDQTVQRAIIDWNSFDIGSSAEVLFRHQMGSSAATLNRIYDARPSVIQGRLSSTGPVVNGQATAGGQVILINQNGIVFGAGAQVNTQSLIASTLNLSNQRFMSGSLVGAEAAFAGSYNDAGETLAARPNGSVVLTAASNGQAAPVLQAGQGGSIMIFAPTIDNQGGVIRAPDGQVILAAGSRAYLAINPDSNDTTLRGYVVEVEAPAEGPALNITSLIRNAGEITADRGNVTLAALAVNQEGRISAKTALQANGSIYLKARTRDKQQSGTVNFKAGSVTEVVPDAADTSTVPDSQAYAPTSGSPTDYRGAIEVSGRTIESHGAILARGGRIKLDASSLDDAAGARVYLGTGSETSVAGTWADVDYRKNIQTFLVTSNELKNSPDQKDGVLRGASVTVDLRENSNALDLTGYRGLVARTVSEKAATGGELQINSSGSVLQRAGAVIDASGGGYRYGGGLVATTRLLGADGKVYDIATAPQGLRYLQLLDSYQETDARWGQTSKVSNPLGAVGRYQAGYVEGQSGGSVIISSGAGLVLDGTLKGGVTIGERQGTRAPRGASLRIGQYENGHFNQNQRVGSITWAQEASDTLGAAFNASTALTQSQQDGFTLAADQVFGAAQRTPEARVESGFGAVELNSNGRISVGAGVKIESDPGAELTLRAQQIDIAGDIRLAGGKITLHAAQADAPLDLVAGSTDNLRVRAGADLSTAGLWVNNSDSRASATGAPPTGRLNASGTTTNTLDGGSITLMLQPDMSQFQTTLEQGSSFDVGGGALLGTNQRVTAGKGGQLTIANGVSGQVNPDWLQADLRGFAVGKGGSLTLKLGRAEIVPDGTVGVVPAGTTQLQAGLFAEQGFSSVTVEAADGIDVRAGTQIKVEQRNLVLDDDARRLATGGDIASVATVQRLPDAQRGAATVQLNARGEGATVNGGRLHVAEGARIETDPAGTIALSARDDLRLDGQLVARGGKVSLALNGTTTLGEVATGDLHLGATADISVAGTFVPTPDAQGLVQGTLHHGGSVELVARRAGVRIDEGARIDVSGVSQTVDVVLPDNRIGPVKQALEGQAGAVLVKSQGAAVLNGTMVAHGGSASAAGGSFALELTAPDGQVARPADRRIVVTPGAQPVAPVEGAVDGVVDATALAAAGFDKLRLQSENRIEFQQATTLDFERGVRLDAPLIDVADGARVKVRGSTVSVGQSMPARTNQVVNGLDNYNLEAFTASPVLATRAGTGELHVQGGHVNLYGNLTVNGTQLTRIESENDIQLVGRPVNFAPTVPGGQSTTRQIGSLTSAGNIELQAAQVYPATRTEYSFAVKDSTSGTLVDQGRISVSRNNAEAASVYSAGGKLALEAHTIEQGGVLKAPQGEITLQAGSRLALQPGSITSVSSDGLTVLYGSTNAGTQWNYDDGDAARPVTSITPQGKGITLSAPAVEVQAGATVDLSGGGDVRAVEFVKGSGGDNDVTLADNTYAIIPVARLAAMPFDNHTLKARDPGAGFSLVDGRDKAIYDSIRIEANGAVPAGEYVLLPARFALLPDAYLVEIHAGAAYRNLQATQTTLLQNGSPVLAARRSVQGTDLQESQTVGVVVRPGQAGVRRSSDHTLSGAAFFAEAADRDRKAAPPGPWDAGRLLIDNASSLRLDGAFNVAAGTTPAQTAGRVADIDVNATRIAVVDAAGNLTVPDGFLQIEGQQLSNLNGNVLLGGKRTHTDAGLRISASAADGQIIVANSAAGEVTLSELTLVAGDSIDVRSGSVLTASGTPGTGPQVIHTDASGAFVRLSAGTQVQLDRGTASADAGRVTIGEGATLNASKSLLVDATQSTQSSGTLTVGGTNGAGGSLALSSGQVTLGDLPAGSAPQGLVVSAGTLAQYAALDELVLRGYAAIDLMGNATLGSSNLQNLTLDTPLLRGRSSDGSAAPQAALRARNLTLANHSASVATAATGSGSLSVEAERLVLGAGSKSVEGFGTVTLTASDTLALEGKGSFTAAAGLDLRTPRVLAAGGSQQLVRAADTSQAGGVAHAALRLNGTGAAATPAPASETELGGRLSLQGSDVTVATTVQARSGQIDVVAHGAAGRAGTVTLDNGAVLDARGQAKDFNGTLAIADGGGVSLTAASGRVDVNTGARVDVSAAEQGGGAGRFALQAQSLNLAGDLSGRAGAGARSGSAEIDLGAFSVAGTGFSSLNSALNDGGFAEARQVRLRTGDLAVAAGESVDAKRVSLSADAGRIDVSGRVGTGAPQGAAQVSLFASDGITLAAGSELRAGASQAGGRGGEVRVATTGGELVFDRDATIDARAGAGASAGSVIFGVSRGSDNAVAAGAAQLDGRVLRGGGTTQASVDVEATRVYQASGSVTADDITRMGADHASFTNTATLASGLRDEDGNALAPRVVGATELRSSGDLTLNSNWNLADEQWLAGGRPGTLTVRAAGNLTVASAIGSPDDNILAGDTWNLRLAAGADLGAANPLAVLARGRLADGSGNLLLTGANAKLRTGTGRIDLAAGRDLRIDNAAATIYTAGRIGAPDTELNGNNRWAVDGGGISMQASGDISGAEGVAELWVNDWLRRPRTNLSELRTGQKTDWWSYRPRFQQGVGTLGGGDIEVAAGGDLRHFSAMAPTSGRTYADGSGARQVDVQGGGDVTVRAAGDVVAGSFLVGRGTGRVEAGGDVGVQQRTQLYVMGTSSGVVPEGAGIDVSAGGSIALQSVFNPTAMPLLAKASSGRETGPSFGSGTQAPHFFTYAPNSWAGLSAKGGNLSYEFGGIGAQWRSINPSARLDLNGYRGALPPRLNFVAFGGDINGPSTTEAITTFPSASAGVRMLAGRDLNAVGFHGSDMDLSQVPTTTNYLERTAVLDGLALQADTNDLRMVRRTSNDRFVFELQALDGQFRGSSEEAIVLPAASRIRAAGDVEVPSLRLQNLAAGDVTEIRSDNGDIRTLNSIDMRGPGRLVMQAGRNIDLGIALLEATGNTNNDRLPNESARVTLIAGVAGEVNLPRMEAGYAEIVALNKAASDIVDFYNQLGTETDTNLVLNAASVASLAQQDAVYARFASLDQTAPRALQAYKDALRAGSVPLSRADSAAGARLYALLNEVDVPRLQAAGSVAALAAAPGGAAYRDYVELERRYGRVFSDYLQRRNEGAKPTSVVPMVLSIALSDAVNEVVPTAAVGKGHIFSYQTSIQTLGGSDIDLWAPGGDIVVGLTTPPADKTVGVLTNAGGAVRAVLAGDFNINQGKVITAQGGDIMLFSSQGSIDAGRGAKTSLSTPPPRRTVKLDPEGNPIGVEVTISTAAAGSGIQTLTSDPDGLGPLSAPEPGSVFLFAPAGSVDAGEAGIRSGKDIFVGGFIKNPDRIDGAGKKDGLPPETTGSLAATLATSGGTGDGGAKAVQDAAKNATEAARAATSAGLVKPKILTVEVMGFGEKGCAEKDCFGK